MPKKSNPAAGPPLERAVRSVAEVHAQHLQDLPPSQLGIEWLTDRIGRPWFAYAVVAFMLAWIGFDAMLARHGRFDAPSFPLLQLLIGAFSLLMAVFILITENRQGTIAEKRAQLTLQLSLANEERAAKIIELLQQMRRDDPSLPNRPDKEAQQMAQAIDLETAMETMENAANEAKERAKQD